MKNNITKKQQHILLFIALWSRLVIDFTFKRNTKIFLFRDFLSCFIIVNLSWINFWVNYRSTPARVLLGIASVLAIFTTGNQIMRAGGPIAAQQHRSIDNYIIVCALFVFLALLESMLVGMTAPNAKPVDRLQQMMDILQNDDDDDDAEEEKTVSTLPQQTRNLSFLFTFLDVLNTSFIRYDVLDTFIEHHIPLYITNVNDDFLTTFIRFGC